MGRHLLAVGVALAVFATAACTEVPGGPGAGTADEILAQANAAVTTATFKQTYTFGGPYPDDPPGYGGPAPDGPLVVTGALDTKSETVCLTYPTADGTVETAATRQTFAVRVKEEWSVTATSVPFVLPADILTFNDLSHVTIVEEKGEAWRLRGSWRARRWNDDKAPAVGDGIAKADVWIRKADHLPLRVDLRSRDNVLIETVFESWNEKAGDICLPPAPPSPSDPPSPAPTPRVCEPDNEYWKNWWGIRFRLNTCLIEDLAIAGAAAAPVFIAFMPLCSYVCAVVSAFIAAFVTILKIMDAACGKQGAYVNVSWALVVWPSKRGC